MNSATKYVARQLQSLLGTYVDGVTEETLSLQLLGGKLKLENLKIRETAFAELELPVRASGRVGKLELSVNLLRFWWNEPVVIGLEDVDIEIEPLQQGPELDPRDYDSHFERIRKWKEGQIRAIQEKQESSQRNEDGFLARLARKVRDSLELRIRNFNICYTDRRSSAPEESFIFCLGMRSLVSLASNSKAAQAATAVDHGKTAAKEEKQTKKLLKVDGLYFYIAPPSQEASLPSTVTSRASREYRQAFDQYMIVREVNVAAEFVINDNHQFKLPEVHLNLNVDPVEWRFLQRQYILLYKIIEECSAYRSRLEHWHWRPREPPMRQPRRWLQYAARCVREQVHHRRFASRHGEAYVRAYRSHLLGQHSNADRREMLRLEKHMGAESISACRTIAQQAAAAHEAATADAKRDAARQRSWGQWARSFVASTAPEGGDADVSSLDEESQRILEEALQQTTLGGDRPMEANAFPREYGRYRFDFRASMGSLILADGGWAGGRPLEELCYMRIDALDGFYEIRSDTYRYCFDIEAFQLENRQAKAESLLSMAYSLPGGKSPIVPLGTAGDIEAQPKVTSDVPKDEARGVQKNDAEHKSAMAASGRRKLFSWSFDTLPLSDRDSDGGEIKVVINGLNLVYSWKQLVLGVYSFWFVPKSERFPVNSGRGDSAQGKSLVDRWADRTRFDKSMRWEVEVLQLCVAFPADADSEREPVIVLALDRLHWFSEPADWLDARKAVDMTAQYYDRNIMRLEGIRFRIADNISSWRRSCAADEAAAAMTAGEGQPAMLSSRDLGALREMTIAEDFGLEFSWDLCRLTDEVREAMSFARHKMAISVEEVHLACTAEQYNLFFYVLFAIIRSHYETKPQVAEVGKQAQQKQEQELQELQQKKKELYSAQEDATKQGRTGGVGSPSVLFNLDIGNMDLDMLPTGEARTKCGFALLHFGGWAFHYENGHRARFQMRMRELKLDDISPDGGLCFARSGDGDGQTPILRPAESCSTNNFVIIERGWNDTALFDHPGYDQWWNFEFSTLNINWNNSSVRALTRFVDESYREKPASKATTDQEGRVSDSAALKSAVSDDKTKTVVEAKDAEVKNALLPRPRLQITASMHRLNADLIRDGRAIVRVAMSATTFKYSRGAATSTSTGKLGDFVIEDLLGPEGSFREKLGLRDKSRSVVDFEYRSYRTGEADYPGHDAWLALEMSSTRLVYSRKFMEAMRGYLTSEPLMSELMGKTASAVAASAKRAAGQHRQGHGLTKVRCRLVNPLVVLPVDEGNSSEYLVADLGEILLENRFESEDSGSIMEHFDIAMRSMNVQDFREEFMVERVNLSLKGYRRMELKESQTPQQGYVECDVSDVKLVCADTQLALACRIFAIMVSSPKASSDEDRVDESNYLSANEDEDDIELFVDASDNQPWLRHLDVRFALRCTWLEMLCKRATPDGYQDFLRLSIGNIDSAYSQLNQTVGFAIKLASVDIHDISLGSAAVVPLLCSRAEPSGACQHVLSIKYTGFSSEASNEQQHDVLWDLDFQTLLLTWDANTMAAVQQFAHVAHGSEFSFIQSGGVDPVQVSSIPPLRNMHYSPCDAKSPTTAKRRLKVTAAVRMISATVTRERRSLCHVAIAAGTCLYERSAKGSSTVARLGDFVVEDLQGPEGAFREKLGLRDKSQSVVEFEYCTYEAGKEDHPGYDAWLTLEMSSTRLVYSRRFIEAIREYLASEPLISELMGKTASAVAASAKRAAGQHQQGHGLTKVRCRLVNPLVVLPVDEGSSSEYLVADLGEILLENHFDAVGGSQPGCRRLEHFEARIKSMNLQDYRHSFVLENIDMTLSGHRDLPNADGAAPAGAIKVSTAISDILMNASDHHLRLIIRLVDQAIAVESYCGTATDEGHSRNTLAAGEGHKSGFATMLTSSPLLTSFRSPSVSPGLAPLSASAAPPRLARSMWCEVVVGNVEVRLFRSRETERQPIATLRLSRLGGNYCTEGFIVTSMMRLGAIEVEDHLSTEKRLLVSSQGIEMSQSGQQQVEQRQDEHNVQHLLIVEYKAVWLGAPGDSEISVKWDLRFQSLLLNWDDRTVAALMHFAKDVWGGLLGLPYKVPARSHSVFNTKIASTPSKGPLLAEASTRGPEESCENGNSLPVTLRRHTELTICMQMLSAALMRDGVPVARLAMTAATLTYRAGGGRSSMTGNLGDFMVEDLLGLEGRFKEKLGRRDKSRSVVEFEYCTYEAGEADYPGHDAWLALEMSSTRLVYSRKFMEAMRGYLTSEPLISELMGKTASAVAASAKRAAGQHQQGHGLTKVRCRLVNPLVVLPVDEGNSSEYLVADLGEILLENRFELSDTGMRTEHFQGRVRSMNMQDYMGEYLMKNIDVDMRGQRSLSDSSISSDSPVPSTTGKFSISGLPASNFSGVTGSEGLGALWCQTDVSDITAQVLPRQVVLLNDVILHTLIQPLLEPNNPPAPGTAAWSGSRLDAGERVAGGVPDLSSEPAAVSSSGSPMPPTTESTMTRPAPSLHAVFCFSRVQLSFLETVDSDPIASRQNSCFSLLRPSLAMRRHNGEMSVVFSILRLGISHGTEPAGPGDPVPRLLLRYYEPEHVESPHSTTADSEPSSSAPSGPVVSASTAFPSQGTPIAEKEDMPQLRFEYSCSADTNEAAHAQVFLFRPEMVLQPQSLVDIYNYFVRIGDLLAGRLEQGHLYAALQSPSKRRKPTNRGNTGTDAAAVARPPTALVIEVRKPRISFVESGPEAEGGAKLVVQSTIMVRGRFGAEGLDLTGCSLASAEMFVSEDGSDTHMRSLVDPFDIAIEYTRPDSAATAVAMMDGNIGSGGLGRLRIATSSNVEAQVSYNDCTFALALVHSWRAALATRTRRQQQDGDVLHAGTFARGLVSASVPSGRSPAEVLSRAGFGWDEHPMRANNPAITCEFRSGSIGVVLINDCFSNSHMPVLEVRGSNLSAFYGPVDGAGSVVLQVDAALEVDYFNMEVAAWEPFLEHWPVRVMRQTLPGTPVEWNFSATEPGYFNLTQAFAQCVALNRRTFVKALQSLENTDVATTTSTTIADGSRLQKGRKITLLHPFHVRNETGVRVECSSVGGSSAAAVPTVDAVRTAKSSDIADNPTVIADGNFCAVVEPGECVPLDIRSSRRTQRKRLAQSQSMLLRVGDAWRPLAVRIDRVGAQNLALQPLDEARGVPCKVVCEIILMEGSRHILLRSSVQVINRTLRGFSLLLEPDGILPAEGSGFDLGPEAESPIPVQMVAHCSLRVQPGAGRVWSTTIRLRQIPRDQEGRPTAQYVLYRDIPPEPSDEFYDIGAGTGDDPVTSPQAPLFAWIRVESADGFRLTVTITPIVTLHNELASAITYRVIDGGLHRGRQSEARGRIAVGGRAEFHHFSPDEAAYLSILLPGFRRSALATTPRTANGELARIQPDRAINSEAELHREVICRDETREDLALIVSITNAVISTTGRPGSSAGGRDRHVTLSCPFWIRNVTGLPLSFCLGSFQPGAEHELVPTLPSVQLPEVVQQVQQHLTSTVSSSLGLPRMPSVRESFAGMTSSALSMVTPRGITGGAGGGAASGSGALSHRAAHSGGNAHTYVASGREPDPQMAGQAEFHKAEQALGTLSEGMTGRPLRSAEEMAVAVAAERNFPCLMFAFAPRVRRALFVRVAGSQWSRDIPVRDGGASGVVEVPSPSTGDVFQLSVTRETRSSPYHRSEVLVFRSRFVLVNLAPWAVAYRQAGTTESHAVRLHPRHRTNFHWTDGGACAADRALCIRPLSDPDATGSSLGHCEWDWSGGIDINALGDTHVRLRSLQSKAQKRAMAHRIVRVEVRAMSDTLYIIIHPEAPANPPYRLENMSKYPLKVRQADPDLEGSAPAGNCSSSAGASDLIGPGECVPFAWDEPLHPPRLVVEVQGPGTTAVYDLDVIRDHAPMHIGGDMLDVTVAAEGPVKVFRVTARESSDYSFESGPALASTLLSPTASVDNTGSEAAKQAAEAATVAEKKKRQRGPRELSVTVSLDKVSITAADLQPRELATAHLEGVRVRMHRICSGPEDLRTVEFHVDTMQVDNMLHRTPYPVILRSSSETTQERPFLQADLTEDLGDTATEGVSIFKSLRVVLTDTELCLEKRARQGRITLLLYLYGLAVNGLLASGPVGPPPSEAEVFESSATRRRRFYFERLLLPEVNVNFSFARRELAAGDDPRAAAAAQRLAWLAASVDHAPLTLKELRTSHVFVDLETLGSVLLAHYQSECRRQLLRVLSSVEILGNPAGLFRNFGTGFRALRSGIEETVRESGGDTNMRPAMDGAKAMLKHGTHGLSNTISKVSSSMSRGVAALAFDEEFLKERETAKDDKGRPLSASVGAAAGTDNVKRAFQSGIMGLLRKPREGYTSGGMRGMAYGVGLGVAGVICKPASGVLDFIANTTEGISIQTNPTGKKPVKRIREPRDLESDRVLRPLDASPPHLHSDLLRRLASQYVRGAGAPGSDIGAAVAMSGASSGLSDAAATARLYGEDLRGDSYRSHVSVPRGVILITDRHCIYAVDRPQPNRSPPAAASDGGGDAVVTVASAWELGWNAPLDAALVHRCTLEWHVLLGDVASVTVAGGDVQLKASREACAAWDEVCVPGCGPLAEEVRQVLDDARLRVQAPPAKHITRAGSFR